LTRVIAGPVCSRYLGALGADVLRLDPPSLPDGEPGAPADTLLGKRSAFLDLGTAEGAARLEVLLAEADVVLLSYRPGSLARFGLASEDLAARNPGLVVMELAAWGHTGPWRERRGFDSIVRAASGIAALEADPDGTPGALPCQLLDHGTGYLVAAAVLESLAEQRDRGGTHLLRLSLARTAHWLLGGEDDPPAADPAGTQPARPRWDHDGAAFATAVDADPTVVAVPPPGSLGGAPLSWPGPAGRYGASAVGWG
jgi:crotonobetainyl-CoA:carnitine CoA-transferase CaiB-like acyl-CoA transferase